MTGPTPSAGAPFAAPPWGSPQDHQPAPLADAERVWTIMGSTKRTGAWEVPARLVLSVAMGDVRIDLREARFAARNTEIEVRGLMGDVKIIAPDTMRVRVTGSPIMAEFRQREGGETAEPPPDAPQLLVTGSMAMGDVTVWRTGDPVGSGTFGVDGLAGIRQRRRERRRSRRHQT